MSIPSGCSSDNNNSAARINNNTRSVGSPISANRLPVIGSTHKLNMSLDSFNNLRGAFSSSKKSLYIDLLSRSYTLIPLRVFLNLSKPFIIRLAFLLNLRLNIKTSSWNLIAYSPSSKFKRLLRASRRGLTPSVASKLPKPN